MFDHPLDCAGDDALSALDPAPRQETTSSAQELNERYGTLPASALLETMLRHVFAGRIALVSSFGTDSPSCCTLLRK